MGATRSALGRVFRAALAVALVVDCDALASAGRVEGGATGLAGGIVAVVGLRAIGGAACLGCASTESRWMPDNCCWLIEAEDTVRWSVAIGCPTLPELSPCADAAGGSDVAAGADGGLEPV